MTMSKINPELDLILEHVEDLEPEIVGKTWARLEHLKRWYVPAPWTIAGAEVDVDVDVDVEADLKPRGIVKTVIQSPKGQKFLNKGCFVEIVLNKKMVWIDLLLPGFRPVQSLESDASFALPATILIGPQGKGTEPQAIVMPGDPKSCKRHEALGFHDGHGKCLDQLVAQAPQIG
jgi:uncharacterized protein YndB with AHSA1/START domain